MIIPRNSGTAFVPLMNYSNTLETAGHGDRQLAWENPGKLAVPTNLLYNIIPALIFLKLIVC